MIAALQCAVSLYTPFTQRGKPAGGQQQYVSMVAYPSRMNV